MILPVTAGNSLRSVLVQYSLAALASVLIIQVAWDCRSALPRTLPHRATAFQALTASLEDSWLLPSANGLLPEAHAWPAYGSKLRYCGNAEEACAEAMSATTRSTTGAILSARAGSFAETTAAA